MMTDVDEILRRLADRDRENFRYPLHSTTSASRKRGRWSICGFTLADAPVACSKRWQPP
jgi:hypothetical protein